MQFPARVKRSTLIAIGGLALGLTACGGSDKKTMEPQMMPEPVMASYEVTITNVTHGQPLSPPALFLHTSDVKSWMTGSSASQGLEVLAESGSTAELLAATSTINAVSGDAVIIPGDRATYTLTAELEAESENDIELTVVSMLVNTNDAFTGVQNWYVGEMEVMDEMKALAPVYDAGTEANVETQATIPGPAAGGEGYNMERMDTDKVSMHPGVVTQADGYAESALTQTHKFDNGAMVVVVKRVQ